MGVQGEVERGTEVTEISGVRDEERGARGGGGRRRKEREGEEGERDKGVNVPVTRLPCSFWL